MTDPTPYRASGLSVRASRPRGTIPSAYPLEPGCRRLAQCHGGIAFANSSDRLVHGMSRPLGAVFGIPHGLSNAVLLPTVTAYSLAGAPGRYATVARTLGIATVSESDEVPGEAARRAAAAR